MSVTDVAARVSALAARQWGLLTTAQAEAEGVTRLQLARLADAGVIERVDRGIYAPPASIDEHTPLRSAWLSLAPRELAEDRLTDAAATGVISHSSAASLHGLGDLLDDEPEITVSGRKQSRRGIRLHRAALRADEVTIVDGLPVTTPARTVADLLRDGHDPSHVAEIAGDALRQDLASRDDLASALEPLARRNGQPSGAALLEHLLDLVGLSGTALATTVASSELGRALVSVGQLSAIKSITEAFPKLDISKIVLGPVSAAMADMVKDSMKSAAVFRFPKGLLPKIDISAISAAVDLAVSANSDALRKAVSASAAAGLPDTIRSVQAAAWSAMQGAPIAGNGAEESE